MLWLCSLGHEGLKKDTFVFIWQFINMSEDLDSVPQSHKDQNHISEQIDKLQ